MVLAHLFLVAHNFRGHELELHLVGIEGSHEEPLGKWLHVHRVLGPEDDLRAGVGEDGVVHRLAVFAGIQKLRRELVGERQVQAKAPGLIKILCNRRRDEVLALVDVA